MAITSSTTVTGSPLRRATRSRRAGSNIDLAVHGAGGDGRDEVLQADFSSEFIDAFLTDHGGVHVGDEQLLAPGSAFWTTISIRRSVDGGGEGGNRFGCIRAVLQRDVAGDPVGQPVEAGG